AGGDRGADIRGGLRRGGPGRAAGGWGRLPPGGLPGGKKRGQRGAARVFWGTERRADRFYRRVSGAGRYSGAPSDGMLGGDGGSPGVLDRRAQRPRRASGGRGPRRRRRGVFPPMPGEVRRVRAGGQDDRRRLARPGPRRAALPARGVARKGEGRGGRSGGGD